MLDDMANFWAHSAGVFAANPAVVGYELINEPWAGDVYKTPELFLPGVAGSRNLQPTYDRMATAIRSIDDTHVRAWTAKRR